MWTFPPKGFPEIKKMARCEASFRGIKKIPRSKSSKKLEQIIQETGTNHPRNILKTYFFNSWLVVYLPLWKIYKNMSSSVGMMTFPMESHNPFMVQTPNQSGEFTISPMIPVTSSEVTIIQIPLSSMLSHSIPLPSGNPTVCYWKLPVIMRWFTS